MDEKKAAQTLWRQWKRNYARVARLINRGLPAERALEISHQRTRVLVELGVSHMNEAFPKSYFDQPGACSLLYQKRRG